MKLQTIHFDPVAMLQFTADDVLILKRCAETHYDRACRAAGEQGGLLHGVGNAVEYSDGVRSLKFGDIDLLCKVLEFPPPGVTGAGDLYGKLRQTLNNMQKVRPASIDYTHSEL